MSLIAVANVALCRSAMEKQVIIAFLAQIPPVSSLRSNLLRSATAGQMQISFQRIAIRSALGHDRRNQAQLLKVCLSTSFAWISASRRILQWWTISAKKHQHHLQQVLSAANVLAHHLDLSPG